MGELLPFDTNALIKLIDQATEARAPQICEQAHWRLTRPVRPGDLITGSVVRLLIDRKGFARLGETATVAEVDPDADHFIVAFDRVRTLRLYGSDEGVEWERF